MDKFLSALGGGVAVALAFILSDDAKQTRLQRERDATVARHNRDRELSEARALGAKSGMLKYFSNPYIDEKLREQYQIGYVNYFSTPKMEKAE